MTTSRRQREQSASDAAADEAIRAEHESSAAEYDLHKLVELVRLDAIEAEIVASHLRSADIPASVFGVGSAGMLSAIQFVQGSRVMVRQCDLESAQALVTQSYASEPADDIASDEELTKLADASLGWCDPETGAVV